MSVKIRLKRTGRHAVATYRIVVTDSRSPRDGRFIEEIGYYHPVESKVVVNKESALNWLKKGAQPSDTIKNILSKEGIIKEYHDFKVNAKKASPKKEKAPEAAKKAAAPKKPAAKKAAKKAE